MKIRMIVFVLVCFLLFSFVQAQKTVSLVGSGKTSAITPGQTVSGEIFVSADSKDIPPISFVGHNGSNRVQGDFDAWVFDAALGENYIISVKATNGDLRPTLLLTTEERIPGVSALDSNADEDANAGVCLRNTADRRYTILVYRQSGTAQTGQYELSLTAASADDLSGGSPTAVCKVGTFVTTLPDTVVNIRNGEGVRFGVIGKMQPNQLYVMLGTASVPDWRHILFMDDAGALRDGYVSERYTIVTTKQPGDSP
jgi:hypothetical protein